MNASLWPLFYWIAHWRRLCHRETGCRRRMDGKLHQKRNLFHARPFLYLEFFGEGSSHDHVDVAKVDDGGVEKSFVYRFSIRRFELWAIAVVYVFAGQGKTSFDYGFCDRVDIEEDCPKTSRQLFPESRFAGGGRAANYVQRWHASPFTPRLTRVVGDFAEPAILGIWSIPGKRGRQ